MTMKLVLKPLEWAVFANELSLSSSYILMAGAAVGMIASFPRWQVSIYSIFLSILIFTLEYPRMYRKNLAPVKRVGQTYFELFVTKLGIYGRSYYIRFYMYFCLSIPCFFLLPTFFGGTCILTGAFIYLKASLAGFIWQPFPRSDEDSVSVCNPKYKYDELSKMKETVC